MKATTAIALGALALAACDAQLPGGASYELVRASESELPFTLRNAEGCVHRLHGGTVQLDGRGGYHSDFDIRITCQDSTHRLPNASAAGRFLVRNDTAFFTDSAGVDAGKGRLTADSLVLRGPLHRLVYLRR